MNSFHKFNFFCPPLFNTLTSASQTPQLEKRLFKFLRGLWMESLFSCQTNI